MRGLMLRVYRVTTGRMRLRLKREVVPVSRPACLSDSVEAGSPPRLAAHVSDKLV